MDTRRVHGSRAGAAPAGVDWIVPGRPLPASVGALVSTRSGGVSPAPWDGPGGTGGMNLGMHVGDDPEAVRENRRRLRARLPAEPAWLEQVHGTEVVCVDALPEGLVPRADAAVSFLPGRVCAVMTADCLPVLLAADDGSAVGAAHAGWRGLAAGVIEAAVHAMRAGRPGARLVAWLGPAIGPDAFEVGDEVRAKFVALHADDAAAFRPGREPGKWWADLPALAARRLRDLGIDAVGGGDLCTVKDPARFHSHRRDGRSGRMASCIWLRNDDRRAG